MRNQALTFAPHFDSRVRSVRLVCCGLAFYLIQNMKKPLLLFAALALFAVGCQTDNSVDKDVAVGEGTVLTVSLEQTRTSIGSKVGDGIYPCYWSDGDKIVVNGNLSDEVQIAAENRASATFRFSNTTISHPYHITYPYCASTTAEKPIVEFSAEQSYAEGSFATNVVPMCGYTANPGDKITLKHLAAVLRLPVKAKFEGVVLEKVVITSTSGAKISGEFEVDCKGTSISATESCGNVVTYTLPANFTLSTSKESPLFIVLPAVEVGTCRIEFVEVSGEKMVANWSPNNPLSKGVVREFKTILYEPKVTTSLVPMTTETDEFKIFYKNLSGYVRYSDGSPIANVAVSDGFQVTTTDANGYYELNGVTRDAWYIYCSLPADVKVPIDEYGRPCFFQKYEANIRSYDFTFEKLPGGKESKFALLALADTQVGNLSSVDQFKAQAAPEINNYANSLGYNCYGVALGDVIYSPAKTDNEYLMPEMRQAFDECGIPIFAVFGNHDNAHFAPTKHIFADERSSTFNLKIQRVFEECFGPINYSFNRGDVHVICMRNMQWKSNDDPAGDNTSTKFTDEQYAWLQQDLACVSKDKTIVLCVHIPIFNKGKQYTSCKLFDDALTLFDEFNASYILSGHLHYRQCFDHIKKGTGHKAFEQSWAMSHSAKPNINCDGSPHGYGVILFEGGAMKKSIHKGYPYGMNSEDYQIRLHRGGDITGAAIPEGDANKYGTKGYYQFPYDSNTILANVFSSDQWHWTVEVWTYDASTGAKIAKLGNMTSLSSYGKSPAWEDLIGSFTYDDPKRVASGQNSGRDFWTTGVRCGYLGSDHEDNYHVCYTMWKYRLDSSQTDKDIMVVAKDRWGNEYTQTEFQVGTDIGYAVYNAELNP